MFGGYLFDNMYFSCTVQCVGDDFSLKTICWSCDIVQWKQGSPVYWVPTKFPFLNCRGNGIWY